MNTILSILPWAVAAAAGLLYYFNLRKTNELREVNSEIQEEYQQLQEELRLIQKENSDKIKELEDKYLIQKNELREKSQYILKVEEEVAALHNSDTNTLHKLGTTVPILTEQEFPFDFSGTITWNLINIPVQELIESERLKEVFYSLLQAKLFPAKIKNKINYSDETEKVLIYCSNSFEDKHGESYYSISWQTILSQILQKRSILNEYLQGVIQESETAMVVSRVLTEKNKSEKEATNA